MISMIVPGRILIVDDIPTDMEKKKVDRLVDSLREQGESVLFSTSVPDKESFFENVRLLIVDLLLAGQDEDKSYEMVSTIIHKLSLKTSFFIIAIWSKAVRGRTENITDRIKEEFRERAQTDLRAVILDPFGKNVSATELIRKIKKSVASRPEYGLLLEIEASIENARDRTVTDIVCAAEVPAIVEALKEEIGGVTLNREITALFLKILSRHSQPSRSMQRCVNSIVKRPASIDPEKYGHIHSLQFYYEVNPEELVWTGDVLKNKKRKNRYAIVISPACDFAQRKRRKIDYVKILPALRIDNSDLMKSACLNALKRQLNFKKTIKDLQQDILTCNLPERYYCLTYLKDNPDVFYHLVLDLQGVTTLKYRNTGVSLGKTGFTRVCRIDTPLIEDLLQEYSAYSSRIGVTRMPKSVVNAAKVKINST